MLINIVGNPYSSNSWKHLVETLCPLHNAYRTPLPIKNISRKWEDEAITSRSLNKVFRQIQLLVARVFIILLAAKEAILTIAPETNTIRLISLTFGGNSPNENLLLGTRTTMLLRFRSVELLLRHRFYRNSGFSVFSVCV